MKLPRTQMEPTPPDETVAQSGAVLEVEFVDAGRKPVADTVARRVREAVGLPDDPCVTDALETTPERAQRADH
jgi:hypothetical protein